MSDINMNPWNNCEEGDGGPDPTWVKEIADILVGTKFNLQAALNAYEFTAQPDFVAAIMKLIHQCAGGCQMWLHEDRVRCNDCAKRRASVTPLEHNPKWQPTIEDHNLLFELKVSSR